MNDLRKREWITGNDTGRSSQTIWCVMMGVRPNYPDIPYDADDFGRCDRLLKKFPEWRGRMKEVAAAHPKWGPIVEVWDKLEKLYEAKEYRKLYEVIQSVRDECMVADGWTKTGPGSWRKGDGWSISNMQT